MHGEASLRARRVLSREGVTTAVTDDLRRLDASGITMASMGSENANRAVFGRPDVVRFYATRDALQGGEATVLRELTPRLADCAMLDVGVGGGRTTLHFASRVRRYVGIDYAPEMIDACRARFPDPTIELLVADARALPFGDDTFDLVMFSHCGIDYVAHDDRLKILREVRRVLWPGGHFSFSTHNLQRAASLLVGDANEGMATRVLRALGRRRLRRINPSLDELGRCAHAMLNDGAFRFGASTYHIRPHAQIEQLAAAGFADVQVLSARSGEVLDPATTGTTQEPWLFYICTSA